MPLMRAVGRQLSYPEGHAGRAIGAVMDLVNRLPVSLALDLLAAAPGERVIDVGCGTGAASQRLLQRVPCAVACVDRSPTMLRRARQRQYLTGSLHRPGDHDSTVTFHLAALGELPFSPASFDAALALNVLYFCDAAGAMLADLKRVLCPGGRLVCYVTHRDTMARWPFVSPGTHRLFDAQDLVQALIAGGFGPDRIMVRECTINRQVRGLLALAKV